MKSNKQQNEDDWEDADDNEEEEQKEETLATPGVVDKYQAGGKIVNSVLEKVIKKCVPGASIVEVCAYSDAELEAELAKIYTKKNKCEKGIGFPTSISCNEICGHFSPLASENAVLKEGDVAKIDLGVHIDGYIAVAAHTVVVKADSSSVTKGKNADVILAAYNAIQAALRLLKPGFKNHQVTEVLNKAFAAYKCNGVEGVLSHDFKKHLIDGNTCIINKETFDQKVEEHEFQVNEVFGLDVIVSTGEGKPKESELRTTIYKRNIERTFILKTKSARVFYNEVIKKYPTLCFSTRSFEDEITAKLGVKECLEHDLLNAYPVLVEKSGDVVAQFKYTVMILQGGTVAITGLPLDQSKFESENKIEDQEVLDLLAMSMDKNSQKSQKKKNKKKTEEKAE